MLTIRRIAIIALLLGMAWGIVGPQLSIAFDRERAKKTAAELQSVGRALGAYGTDFNRYPTIGSIDQLAALLSPKYTREMPRRDGWGHPFRYRSASGRDFVLVSPGSDGLYDFETERVLGGPAPDIRYGWSGRCDSAPQLAASASPQDAVRVAQESEGQAGLFGFESDIVYDGSYFVTGLFLHDPGGFDARAPAVIRASAISLCGAAALLWLFAWCCSGGRAAWMERLAARPDVRIGSVGVIGLAAGLLFVGIVNDDFEKQVERTRADTTRLRKQVAGLQSSLTDRSAIEATIREPGGFVNSPPGDKDFGIALERDHAEVRDFALVLRRTIGVSSEINRFVADNSSFTIELRSPVTNTYELARALDDTYGVKNVRMSAMPGGRLTITGDLSDGMTSLTKEDKHLVETLAGH
jgi:hypothetical protein